MAKRDPNHLTPEKDGRFCKRVRGQLYHFGAGGNRDAALKEWLAVKDDLLAGRKIRRRRTGPELVTVERIKDFFLDACTVRVNAGTLRAGTFDDYYRAADDFGRSVGWGRDPDDLEPEDFARVRREWGKTMGPWALDRNIQAVRTMFNHVAAFRLIDREPFYGQSFSKTTEAEKRKSARKKERARGQRAFTAQEIATILQAATGRHQLYAMILLALNGGMYSTDIASLRTSDIKREGEEWVMDFERGKTGGVPWKFVLWPETKAAIDAARTERAKRKQKARDTEDADRIFLTLHGRAFHREHVRREGELITAGSSVDLIAQEFDKILDSVSIRETAEAPWRKLKRAGVGFGTFRHTHITATGDHPDERATHRVTGHKIGSIKKHYDKIPLARLKSVTDLARSRLLGVMAAPDSAAAPRKTSGQSVAPAADPQPADAS